MSGQYVPHATPGYAYMLFVPNGTCLRVKIGKSICPIKRAREIGGFRDTPAQMLWYAQCQTEDEARSLEMALHRVYADFHLTGEWFEFDMQDKMHKRFFNNAWKPVLRAFGIVRWESANAKTLSHARRAS